MTGINLVSIGIAVIVVGFLILIAGAVLSDQKPRTEAAVVGFIGPVPIGLGTGKDVLLISMAISAVLIILFLR